MYNSIRRITNTSPKILMHFCETLTKTRIRKYFLKLRPIKLSDHEFLDATSYMSLYELLNSPLEVFFINPDEKEKTIGTIKTNYSQTIESTIKDADEICLHIFEILGSGKVNLGAEIDWHWDFINNFRWNADEYYLSTGLHVKLSNCADVKVPWELSRSQQFTTLGKAYWYTGNEKYAKEFVTQIESWIKNNPVELGVNWACTMDVAIRAVNWIWGYYFFYNSKSLNDDFRISFLKILFLHGRHIVNNLEFSPVKGNHYLSDIVGLVYLGIFFQKTNEGKSWLEKGILALKEEMKSQVYPEGVDFEASVSYHRLVTEIFLSATILCLINKIVFPKWYTRRLEKMVEFVMYYTKPDGICPIIGDADDGRLHILAKNYVNDHRYLQSIGAVLFNRSAFKSSYLTFNEEAFWLLGIEGLNKFKRLESKKSNLASKAFIDGGYYIMRKDDSYMIIRFGDVGLQGVGAHSHCDCMSFELFFGGRTLIIDPGVYVYTANPQCRNLFRSTKSHNTIVVDEIDINRFEKNNLFSMHYDAIPKLNKWDSNDEYDYFDGEHYGYLRLNEPVVHRRQIYFNKRENYWVIKDILTGKDVHLFEMYLHFSDVEIELDKFSIKTENGIHIEQLYSENLTVEKQSGFVSPSYNCKYNAPVVKYSKKSKVPVEFITIIKHEGTLLNTNQIMKEFSELIQKLDVI